MLTYEHCPSQVVGTELEADGSRQRVAQVHIQTADGAAHQLPCSQLVNAMGPLVRATITAHAQILLSALAHRLSLYAQAAKLSQMVGLTLPVVPRKRYVRPSRLRVCACFIRSRAPTDLLLQMRVCAEVS
jgi:hypothetical protein